MKRIIQQRPLYLVICFLILKTSSFAQIGDFYDPNTMTSLIVYNSNQVISYNAPENFPDYKAKINYFSIGFEFERINDGKGKNRYSWNYRIANDIWPFILNELKLAEFSTVDEGGMTSGLIGEFSLGWNVHSIEKQNIHVGLVAGDYLLYVFDNTDGLEGWYFGLGPKIGIDRQLTENLALYFYSSAMITRGLPNLLSEDPSLDDPEYFEDVDPIFWSTRIEIVTKKGLFLASNYIKPISDHPIKLNRTDFILGIKL